MIYSFGHTTLPLEGAVKILRDNGVKTLVDIRSHPGSARWPQWNREELEQTIPAAGIEYVWGNSLGGFRASDAPLAEGLQEQYGVDISPYLKGHFPKGTISRKLKGLPDSSPSWTVGGFWDYQFFMMLPRFAEGAQGLLKMDSPAIMCGELLPWSCHRSMVADWMWHVLGEDVTHLQPRLSKHSTWPSRFARYEPVVRERMQALDSRPNQEVESHPQASR
jgi:hypothetical protein